MTKDEKERDPERDKVGGRMINGQRQLIVYKKKREKYSKENSYFSNFEENLVGGEGAAGNYEIFKLRKKI